MGSPQQGQWRTIGCKGCVRVGGGRGVVRARDITSSSGEVMISAWPLTRFSLVCYPRFFLTPPVRPGPPVALRGRLAHSARSAGPAGWHGADKSPAWPSASRRFPWSDTHTSPALRRSRSPDRAHNPPGRLSPTPESSTPTSGEAASVGPVPRGSAIPPYPVRDSA
jgi:hypothetical protein